MAKVPANKVEPPGESILDFFCLDKTGLNMSGRSTRVFGHNEFHCYVNLIPALKEVVRSLAHLENLGNKI